MVRHVDTGETDPRRATTLILGVTIVGVHAGDLIAEYVPAMRHRLGLDKILGTNHIPWSLTAASCPSG